MNKFFSIVCVSAIVVLAGCKTVDVSEGASPGIRINDAEAPNARIIMDTAVILDKSLQNGRAGKLAIESTGARRTATGTLEAYAVIRNRTDYPLQVEGRVQFFDGMNVPVEGPTGWQRIYLDPQAVGAYKELSARVNDIAHYYIEIREGR